MQVQPFGFGSPKNKAVTDRHIVCTLKSLKENWVTFYCSNTEAGTHSNSSCDTTSDNNEVH